MDNEIIIQENDLDWVFIYLLELYQEGKLDDDEITNLAWSL